MALNQKQKKKNGCTYRYQHNMILQLVMTLTELKEYKKRFDHKHVRRQREEEKKNIKKTPHRPPSEVFCYPRNRRVANELRKILPNASSLLGNILVSVFDR